MIRFIVSRASEWNSRSLCEEAVLHTNFNRNYLTSEEVEDGWTIDLEDWDRLEEFMAKYGDIVIYPVGSRKNVWSCPKLPVLTIYDDYLD